jgi:transitional endoplasmic reticulum ATPase
MSQMNFIKDTIASRYWKVRDALPMKKGSSLVEIVTSPEKLADSGLGHVCSGWKRPYVTLEYGDKTVGGTVEAVRSGAPEIRIDPLLRLELNIPEGGDVKVAPLSPVPADSVDISFPESGLMAGEFERLCRTYLSGQPLSKGQIKPLFLFSGKQFDVVITKVVPRDLCILFPETEIIMREKVSSGRGMGFADVGGLDREIQLLQERIVRPLQHKDFFTSMGIRVPRGILFTGPPGCGKTLLARALGRELGLYCIEVSGPEIFAGLYGESEKRVRRFFSDAREHKPALIIFDEIDALAPSRNRVAGELERRIVTMLLAEMDGVRDGDDVMVVGTTNDPDFIDTALRRPGRFDFELRIGVPDKSSRLRILEIHSRHMSLKGVSLEDIAGTTHGFNGADIMNLCREAAFNSLKRNFKETMDSQAHEEAQTTVPILRDDFEQALKGLRPSALREYSIEVPGDLSWDDVGGLDAIKSTVLEEIVKAVADPEVFSCMSIRPVRGVLLYGPPGTGKTLLARVIANQAGANFISVRGPEILSKWLGESEQRIREIFQRAREVSPCILFFDEIDAITAARGRGTSEAADRIVNQLLTEMDGFHSGKQLCVIAATNREDLLDPALLRPGRFDYALEAPLPDAAGRKQIFRIHLRGKPLSDGVNIDALADNDQTEGFSGAHIEEVCRRGALEALRESSFDPARAVVTRRGLCNAINIVRRNIEAVEKRARPIGF